MNSADNERWMELCDLGSKEQDTHRILELVAETNRLLLEEGHCSGLFLSEAVQRFSGSFGEAGVANLSCESAYEVRSRPVAYLHLTTQWGCYYEVAGGPVRWPTRYRGGSTPQRSAIDYVLHVLCPRRNNGRCADRH